MAASTFKPFSKPSRSSPTLKPTAAAASGSGSGSGAATTTTFSVPSHLAMVELKARILSSLSKLSDRDTHQIAVDDLEKIIRTLPFDGVPTLLHSLLHDPSSSSSASDTKSSPSVARRETLRLLSLLCAAHPDAAAAHLPKIVSHIARRLKDPASDSSVRDACRDAAGALAALYIRPSCGGGGEDASGSPVVAMFVRPLLEAMGEQSKVVQAGAAACLAKVVECAGAAGGGAVFQKLCPRICKSLGSQSFLSKGALLSVVSSLAQVGAISPQNMAPMLQSVRECLENSEWATRKAAADTLCVLASQSRHLVVEEAASTIAALEASRFDKVKPVRDSIMEALALWKKVTGKAEDGVLEDAKDGNTEMTDAEEKLDQKRAKTSSRKTEAVRASSTVSSPTESDSTTKGKASNIPEKAVVILKKKAPSLTDKELNPEFFQKLETRSSGDIEVVVPRRGLRSSNSQGEDEPESIDGDSRGASRDNGLTDNELNDSNRQNSSNYHRTEKRLGAYNKFQGSDDFSQDKWTEQRGFRARDLKTRAPDVDDMNEFGQRDPSIAQGNTSRTDGLAEVSLANNKGNWLAIQRQLSQLERQQANIMNMLQDFMGGSHDSMITLENRVRGLERVVEDMARDLAVSFGRRGGSMMGFEGSTGRSASKYNGFHEYPSTKFSHSSDGRIPFAERFLSSDSMISGVRGRDSPWRTDSEAWESYPYNGLRSGLASTRRGLSAASLDGRLPRAEHENDQVGSRRAWDKGQGPFRLGEGPSARSIWQASKDEATLEAIRVAGEDNGTPRSAVHGTIRELDAEALTDENPGRDRGPLWASWTRAMDSLHAGDVDSAYAEMLSTGDDLMLVKLMDKSGPVMDQLSSDIANEVLHAIGQFLLEQSLFDIAMAWIQQLIDLVMENGVDFMSIPPEGKRQILLDLHEACTMELPEDWDGATPDQTMMQLASVWEINLQQLFK